MDPDAKRIYNAYAFEFRARPGRGAQFFVGFAFEGQQDVSCNASDNPNTLRFCDDRENGIPYRGPAPLQPAMTRSRAMRGAGQRQEELTPCEVASPPGAMTWSVVRVAPLTALSGIVRSNVASAPPIFFASPSR